MQYLCNLLPLDTKRRLRLSYILISYQEWHPSMEDGNKQRERTLENWQKHLVNNKAIPIVIFVSHYGSMAKPISQSGEKKRIRENNIFKCK